MTKFTNTRYQVRASDDDEWKDVVDTNGNFTEPTWFDSYQYRRKPKPEVVKSAWPGTTMTDGQLYNAYENSYGYYERLRAVANAAIAHALETGLVVLPETAGGSSKRDSDIVTEASKWMYNKLYSSQRTAYCDIRIDYEAILKKVEN